MSRRGCVYVLLMLAVSKAVTNNMVWEDRGVVHLLRRNTRLIYTLIHFLRGLGFDS